MKFLIVANGPFISRDIIQQLAFGKTIIALDGAANKLSKIGILPQVIIGDFDSITEEKQQFWGIKTTLANKTVEELVETTTYAETYTGNYGCTIVHDSHQYSTDLEKGIAFCDKNGATSIDIVCALGARMDHSVSNLRILRSKHREDRTLQLHTEMQTMYYAKDSKTKISGKFGDYCGIMAFPQGSFSSDTNLRWNVTDYALIFGEQESSSNQIGNINLEKNSAEAQGTIESNITVNGEALIIAPGIVPGQCEYSNKSRLEQLKELCEQEDYMLFETTRQELIEARDVRRKMKQELHVKPANKRANHSPSTHYVSHNKSMIFSSTYAHDAKILVSMPSEKYRLYKLCTLGATELLAVEMKKMCAHEMKKRYAHRI